MASIRAEYLLFARLAMSASYVAGVPRLGVPVQLQSDARNADRQREPERKTVRQVT
jgi:hypothetical protein